MIGYAQITKIRPLKIGDTVPDIAFKMVNYEKATARLSDFKGKLIILDFWATHCAPCIKAMGKFESLQSKFKAAVQIILLNEKTGDTEAKVISFFENRRKKGYVTTLPSSIILSDASALFPHEAIPHCIVIKDNVVMAITSGETITESMIEKYLKGNKLDLPLKIDFFADRLLVTNKDLIIDDYSNHVFFRKRYTDGLSGGLKIRMVEGILRGVSFRNVKLEEMYGAVLRGLRPDIWNVGRLIWSTPSNTMPQEMDIICTYDLVVPKTASRHVYSYALEDLNRYAGYTCKIEKRLTACYILKIRDKKNVTVSRVIDDKGEMILSEDGKIRNYINEDIDRLVFRLPKDLMNIPVVNETGFTKKIDYYLPLVIKDFNSLRQSLNDQGFDLIEAEREIEMFVISEAED
ncbi:thiol-disulfide isomerase/thioredoxin [Pedobacter sp. AK017]|uniref:TlpA family protein disulfide reductase n=1 Tax=Pedobacter sp. AK017 TaxID=2723073 RepID=UPI00160B8112|nr:redoxin domain-containing protein [Pedobacter sp. AK017]MBB5439522.1 thiol-disulfide isomerase/thioredoxin [Pedobacter sp. AK017]